MDTNSNLNRQCIQYSSECRGYDIKWKLKQTEEKDIILDSMTQENIGHYQNSWR